MFLGLLALSIYSDGFTISFWIFFSFFVMEADGLFSYGVVDLTNGITFDA